MKAGLISSSTATLAVLLAVICQAVYALEPMEDDALSTVIGADGVQLTLRLRNNVDDSGAPMGCSGFLNPCRLGLEFSGREGIWLMLKDYYGTLSINDVRLESAVLPSTSTGFQDASRFLDGSGTCLLAGCDPRGIQAVRISYPMYKGTGEYQDLLLLMNIGRTALEFDNGLTPGYLRDAATGSALGFRMADSSGLNAPSAARFDGAAYVFGF
ncbi:MAG: hypothetical protein KAG82_13380 [Alcanivoracaceae bacterium]|nr:hypothetical protein [Alcanivoracaceae bacterium]